MNAKLLVASVEEPGGSVHLLECDSLGFRIVATARLSAEPWTIAVHPNGTMAYVAVWGEPATIVAISIGADSLEIVGTLPSEGEFPCFLTVDPTGSFLLTAHYYAGGTTVHRLWRDGGVGEIVERVEFDGCGPDAARQETAHPHCVVVTPDGGAVYIVDLGTDRIHRFALEPLTGLLTEEAQSPLTVPPGSGPRHVVRTDRALIATGELSSTILLLSIEMSADSAVRSETLPATLRPTEDRNYPSDIILAADGRLALLANRGAGTIAAFSVHEYALERVAEFDAGGNWPLKLAIAGDLLFCAVKDTGLVRVWGLDAASGSATFMYDITLGAPTWVSALSTPPQSKPRPKEKRS